MKRILIIVIALLPFAACKKAESDINPQDPTANLTGKYTLKSIILKIPADDIDFSLPNLPAKDGNTTISGTVEVSKGSSNDTVDIEITVTDGTDANTIPLEGVTVAASGNTAKLTLGNTALGEMTSKSINCDLKSGTNRLAFTANR